MTNIEVMKEQQVTATPVLLFDCRFADGSVERWATHKVQAEGHDYEARVVSHGTFELRLPGDDTVDRAGRVSLIVSNTDGRISQLDRTKGFKGAKLVVRLAFFELETGELATPIEAVYSGVGQPAEEILEDEARLSFTDRFSLTRILQPSLRVQSTCPWNFPGTADERVEASGGGAEGRYSPFWKCGYSPDQADGCGNMNGSAPFASCAKSAGDCRQRGMYGKDANGHATARFGGFSYLPASILVRPHGEKAPRWSDAIDGKARSNDPLPLHYGTGWVKALVNFSRSDGNLTHYELVVCTGQMHRIHRVLADGIEVPPGQAGQNMSGTGWFNVVSDGNRNGGANPFFANASGESEGDPHGSVVTLAVAIPNRLLSGASHPKFEVLLDGAVLPRFAEDETELAAQFTTNPAWILLDIIRRSGWKRDEIDLPSFARGAAFCDEMITVVDELSQTRQVPRFELNLTLTERKSLSEIIRGIRLSTGLTVTLNASGKLGLSTETGIARQHPAKRVTSNASAALSGGWPAYEFGDGTAGRSGILVRKGRSTLRLWRKGGNETPNRLTVELQDSFRAHQQTSVSVVDAEDEVIQGHEVSAGLGALGLPHVNQALRALRHQLNRTIRGNRFVEFESGMQAIGVRPGDLITLTVQSEGFDRQLLRVMAIGIGVNHSTVRLTCREHSEDWYQQFEESSDSFNNGASLESGGALPRVLAGKAFNAEGRTELEVEEGAEDADSGQVELIVRFTPPERGKASRLPAPLVDIVPRVLSSGGTLSGGRSIYYGIAAVDDQGAESALSFLIRADVPAGVTAGAVEITGIGAAPGTASMRVYRGSHPLELYRLAVLPPIQSTYIDTGAQAELIPPRDPNYDVAEISWRFELVPATFATAWSSVSIGNSGLGLAPNAYTAAVAVIVSGKGAGQERRIVSNTSEELLIQGAWSVMPDATSRFSVAAPGWKLAGVSSTDELRFLVPARFGQRVEIIGQSVSAQGARCPRELCPVKKHVLGGLSGSDSDVAGEPVFALSTSDNSEVVLSGIGFASLDNTFSVTGGALTLYYWDEMIGPCTRQTTADVQPGDATIQLNEITGLEVGQLAQIGREIVRVTAVSTASIDVERGQFGTAAVTHSQPAAVFGLRSQVSTLSFPSGFFGSPASGSYEHRVTLRSARVAAAELLVRNRHGDSPVARNEYTSTFDEGMRTSQGAQIAVQLEGVPAVESRIAPPFPVPVGTSIYDIYAVMAMGPVGGNVVTRVRANGRTLGTLTISAGATWSNVVGGFGLAPLAEGEFLEVDILEVPTGEGAHPGRDLTIAVRL
jgi:hypothetical protein